MAVMIKSPAEIEKMRISGRVLRKVHDAIAPHVVAGATTMELEEIAVAKIAEFGSIPAFKGYHGFPYALCTSINEQVVHGMPNPKSVLKNGDILSIDCGVIIDGFYSDAAVTYAIGEQTPRVRRLLEITKDALDAGIEQARVGGRLFDISAAVQETCEAEGFGVVRDFVGHGIGRNMHEDPQVPNFGPRGKGPRLRAGMVLAIEPMINAGTHEVKVLSDGWTAVTRDGSYSAHFEHTVAITENGPQILTL
ncbi:MAG: type I methionyl aminopeptidase [Acidobacteriaceae bacterium]|nr:type I methionyl aminopeptidase [Acidobacteriaceae bacterium]